MSFDHELARATQAFSKNLHTLAQQQTSKLFGTVRIESMETLSKFFDRDASIEMQRRTSRHQNTAYTPQQLSRRRLDISDYECGDIVDREEDVMKAMYDPQSSITQGFVRAANRNLDSVIINEGILGTAYAADADFAISNVAAPTAIPNGGTNLTTDKIKDAIERLEEADVDLTEDRPTLVIGASQYRALLSQSEFINKDFKTGASEQIVLNAMSNFLGIDIIKVSTKDSNPILPKSGNIRTAVLYTKSACILGIQNKFKIDSGKDYSIGGSVRVIGKQNIGSVRMEEARVVPIECDETA